MRNPDWAAARRTKARLAHLRSKLERGAKLTPAEYLLAELHGQLPPEYVGTSYNDYEMAMALAGKRRQDEYAGTTNESRADGEHADAPDLDVVR